MAVLLNGAENTEKDQNNQIKKKRNNLVNRCLKTFRIFGGKKSAMKNFSKKKKCVTYKTKGSQDG